MIVLIPRISSRNVVIDMHDRLISLEEYRTLFFCLVVLCLLKICLSTFISTGWMKMKFLFSLAISHVKRMTVINLYTFKELKSKLCKKNRTETSVLGWVGFFGLIIDTNKFYILGYLFITFTEGDSPETSGEKSKVQPPRLRT